MIEQLSKKDETWRKIAFSICKDKQLADDLVQDMYLKVYNLNPIKANKSYISFIIYHLFIDHIRKQNKTISLENRYILEDISDDTTLEERKLMLDALNQLNLYDREILLHTHEDSLRNKVKELGISITKLFYGKHKALKKLKETEIIKDLIKERKYG